MARLFSNQLKALLVMEDFRDNPLNVLQENCHTVQHFRYEARHQRNNDIGIYGATEPVLLDFTVRLTAVCDVKFFTRHIVLNSPFPFSFLFNASFNDNRRLRDYEDGMVVDGYVVDLKEEFESAPEAGGAAEQILLHVRMLVRSMTVLGQEEQNSLKMVFIQ